MKKAIITLLAILFVITGCGPSNQVVNNGIFNKRKYNKGWHFNKRSLSHSNSSKEERTLEFVQQEKNARQPIFESISADDVSSTSTDQKQGLFSEVVQKNVEQTFRNTEFTASTCDKITLIDGEIVEVSIIEMTESEVYFRACRKSDVPVFKYNITDISSIETKDGKSYKYAEVVPRIVEEKSEESKEIEKNEGSKSPTTKKSEKKKHPLALTSFILGLLTIFIPFMAILTIPFSVFGLIGVYKNPEKFEGKGMAIFGLVVGFLAIILLLFLFLFW